MIAFFWLMVNLLPSQLAMKTHIALLFIALAWSSSAAPSDKTVFATPEEAADGVFLFCTPESNYITGQVVTVGGGLVA